jgi:hypothetical protein
MPSIPNQQPKPKLIEVTQVEVITVKGEGDEKDTEFQNKINEASIRLRSIATQTSINTPTIANGYVTVRTAILYYKAWVEEPVKPEEKK